MISPKKSLRLLISYFLYVDAYCNSSFQQMVKPNKWDYLGLVTSNIGNYPDLAFCAKLRPQTIFSTQLFETYSIIWFFDRSTIVFPNTVLFFAIWQLFRKLTSSNFHRKLPIVQTFDRLNWQAHFLTVRTLESAQRNSFGVIFHSNRFCILNKVVRQFLVFPFSQIIRSRFFNECQWWTFI